MKTPEIHFLCSQRDLLELRRLLKETKGDIAAKDRKNRTILHLACKRGFSEIVDFILENGGNQFIDAQDDDGKTGLYEACCAGHLDIVQSLLAHGAYINVISSPGNVRASRARQALRGACRHQQLEIVKVLVEGGADINTKNSAHESALYESSRDGHTDVVSYLLEMGADQAIMNKRGLLPLHVAIREKHLNVVCLLLGNRADANKTVQGQSWTPLHIAAQVNHLGIAEALLRYDAIVDTQNADGQTALYMACRQGFANMVELLLYYGASPNCRSEGGYTPLHAAAWEGHLQVVDYLLQSEELDIEAKTNFAQTAYNIACEKCHYEVAALLLSQGAKTNLLDGDDEPRTLTPLSPLPSAPSPAPSEEDRKKTLEDSNRRLKPTLESELEALGRLEKERRVKSEMASYLSEQPTVVNRWEKVLINLGLERKYVDELKGEKIDLKEKFNKGLQRWIATQPDGVVMDDVMALVADVLKNNNIGLNSTAGTFSRVYKQQKKKHKLK